MAGLGPISDCVPRTPPPRWTFLGAGLIAWLNPATRHPTHPVDWELHHSEFSVQLYLGLAVVILGT